MDLSVISSCLEKIKFGGIDRMKKFTILITFLLPFVILLSGCKSADQILARKMIDKYAEDQNYVTLSGEIIECNENNVIIKCEELHDYLNYEDDLCDYYVYSDQIIELSVGDQIDFVTVPFHFYNGHKLPIVELKKDGNTFLTFEEGKENLIDWVNTNFK